MNLDVAPAAVGLEVALTLCVGEILAPDQDGLVGGQECIPDASGQCEAVLEAALVQVIEKDTADAARLSAMPKEEIIVARGP